MNELSFLVDLLLNHKLQKATKDALSDRIKGLATGVMHIPVAAAPAVQPAQIAAQPWASTRAAMASHMPKVDAEARATIEAVQQHLEPKTVAVIAQTQATAAAMQSRNQAIAESIAGKVDKVTGRPRKF